MARCDTTRRYDICITGVFVLVCLINPLHVANTGVTDAFGLFHAVRMCVQRVRGGRRASDFTLLEAQSNRMNESATHIPYEVHT